MLQRGDQVPHFTVTDVRGERIAYADIWQRKHLVLVSLTGGESGAEPPGVPRRADVGECDAVLVVTGEPIPGVPRPGVVVADRWGEIAFVTHTAELPPGGEILEWLRFVQLQCPECQGEAR